MKIDEVRNRATNAGREIQYILDKFARVTGCTLTIKPMYTYVGGDDKPTGVEVRLEIGMGWWNE